MSCKSIDNLSPLEGSTEEGKFITSGSKTACAVRLAVDA